MKHTKILKLFATCNTAKEFWSSIPRDLFENIKFRQQLHSCLSDHKDLIPAFTTWCREYKAIMFDTCFFTYDPRKDPGLQNRPFLLRPRQLTAIERLCHSIDNGHDLIIDKSREEGASEMICKLFTIYWLLEPQVYFLIGSRKEELVDKSVNIDHGRVIGPHQTLMHKIMYAIAHLPPWWKVNFTKSHCFLQNRDNDAVIQGEATNDSFGAGNRATAVLIDEHARMEPPIAAFIADNIRDTTNCCIFNSTHFKWGAGHPYAKLLRNDKIEKFELGWEHNPEKNVGLYLSPAPDMIVIYDIDYYRNTCPGIFNDINPGELVNWTKMAEKEDIGDVRFIADGGVSNFGCQRSIWFDGQTRDRSRTMIDIATNILRIPHGSAEMFFSSQLLALYKNRYTVPLEDPDVIRGKMYTDIEGGGKVTNATFKEHIDHNFQWYDELKLFKGKMCPNPRHNYIVSCDISRGTGASNSVAAIIDVNLRKLVGVYVNAYIDTTDFAELAVGLSRWCNDAYLIWEANGPGDTFGKRVLKQGYHNIYWNKDERTERGKHGKKPGWYSTPGINGSKYSILDGMDAGMSEALTAEKNFHYLIIPDHYTLMEMMDYVFAEGRTDVISSTETGNSSSEGKFAHGDRVIAVSLGFFALKYQPKKNFRDVRNPPNESFQARFNKWKKKRSQTKRGRRKYRYD